MKHIEPDELARAVDARMAFAAELFDALAAATRDGEGVTRPAWSEQDQAGVDLFASAADGLGLQVAHDPAGNVYATLPGMDRVRPGVLMGSHFDSVPKGGNFDGAAGAVAGLTVLAALRDLGVTPPCDLRAVGLRGEESVWFGVAYLGSRLAVGDLPPAEIDRLSRGDTGRSLADHMAALGIDVDALRRAGAPFVSARNTKAFLELHIEQGPVLVGLDVPVAVPTVIRGNVRYPYARCHGVYAHSAAVPREYRQDALLATVELVSALDLWWREMEAEGATDTVFTVGKFFTDPGEHAMTKVPGVCDFTLNFGSTQKTLLTEFQERVAVLATEIGSRRRVTFALGDCVGSDSTPLDDGLRERLSGVASALDIAAHEMPTVGHDASIFVRAGIPAAMVLVRNAHGSHNPAEAMDMDDFRDGVRILAAAAMEVADG